MDIKVRRIILKYLKADHFQSLSTGFCERCKALAVIKGSTALGSVQDEITAVF